VTIPSKTHVHQVVLALVQVHRPSLRKLGDVGTRERLVFHPASRRGRELHIRKIPGFPFPYLVKTPGQRYASKREVSRAALTNGFAARDDQAALRVICDRLGRGHQLVRAALAVLTGAAHEPGYVGYRCDVTDRAMALLTSARLQTYYIHKLPIAERWTGSWQTPR
jgi:hypothetical protein